MHANTLDKMAGWGWTKTTHSKITSEKFPTTLHSLNDRQLFIPWQNLLVSTQWGADGHLIQPMWWSSVSMPVSHFRNQKMILGFGLWRKTETLSVSRQQPGPKGEPLSTSLRVHDKVLIEDISSKHLTKLATKKILQNITLLWWLCHEGWEGCRITWVQGIDPM